MAASSSQMTMKLLIDRKANKVLFAEASKEVVDFLCSILTLPVGTVVRILSDDNMVGCLPKLYNSIEGLDLDYIQIGNKRDTVLKPTVHNSTEQAPLFRICSSSVVAGGGGGEGGFVKGVVKYMVTDDLEVTPMSTITGITLLKKFNVDVGTLEEMVVNLDKDMGLKLLKSCFMSKHVLTDVFL